MQVKWLDEALLDLIALRRYIAQDNPRGAAEVARRIKQAVDLLGAQPALGRPGRIHGTRELIISNTPYIAPYRVKIDRIEILRVLHSAMQWTENFRAATLIKEP